MLSFPLLTHIDLYLAFHPKDVTLLSSIVFSSNKYLPNDIVLSKELTAKYMLMFNKTKLFYYINRLISVYHLCIHSFIALDILTIVYEENHLGFAY